MSKTNKNPSKTMQNGKNSEKYKGGTDREANSTSARSSRKDYRKGQHRTNSMDSRANNSGSRSSRVASAPINDFDWYAVNLSLIKDAASLPFSQPLGLPVFENGDTSYAVPGIMTLQFIPVCGVSKDITSPINVAATRLYSFVRHANSGHTNYESSDLFMYIQAMDSVYSYIAWMVRLYGILNDYAYSNRYKPRYLVQALGADFDDLIANMAQFRFIIRSTMRKANALAVPADYSLFKRHIWMCGNYFIDSSGRKAQTYLYNPAYLYRYEGYQAENGGMLTPVPVRTRFNSSGSITNNQAPDGTLVTLQDIESMCNYLLNPLLYDEDINIMSGDILKAFGESALMKWADISDDYTITPVYSAEVLSQIQNTQFAPHGVASSLHADWSYFCDTRADETLSALSNFQIYQEGNVIKFNPSFNYTVGTIYEGRPGERITRPAAVFSGEGETTTPIDTSMYYYWGDTLINSHEDFPSPEFVTVASRNISTYRIVDPTNNVCALETCGSEVFLDAYIYTLQVRNGDVSLVESIMHNYALIDSSSDLDVSKLVDPVVFDWAPTMRVDFSETIGDETFAGTVGYLADLDNYVFVNHDVMQRLHEVCLLSEYTCKSMGAYA